MTRLADDRRRVQGPIAAAAAAVRALVVEPDRRIRAGSLSTLVAILTGAIFVPAGLMKFVFHGSELHAFRTFGLPWPSVLEIVAGVFETSGGILLVLRRAMAPTSVILVVTMVVAIAVSGIGHGDVIPSLTLAPALLVAMLYLLFTAVRPPAIHRRRST